MVVQIFRIPPSPERVGTMVRGSSNGRQLISATRRRGLRERLCSCTDALALRRPEADRSVLMSVEDHLHEAYG